MGVTDEGTYPLQANYLLGLRASDGKQIWKHQLLDYMGAQMLLLNGLIYTSTIDGKIHALKINTGSEVWKTNVDDSFPGHGLYTNISITIAQ